MVVEASVSLWVHGQVVVPWGLHQGSQVHGARDLETLALVDLALTFPAWVAPGTLDRDPCAGGPWVPSAPWVPVWESLAPALGSLLDMVGVEVGWAGDLGQLLVTPGLHGHP